MAQWAIQDFEPEPMRYEAHGWRAIGTGDWKLDDHELRAARARMSRLGVITGLRAAADCLRGFQDGEAPLVATSGGDAERARAGALDLAAKGVAGLVSFGMATGLAPVLRPGDLVLADSVVLPSGQAAPTDPAWRGELARRLGAVGIALRVARIAGSDRPLTSADEKRRAFQATFAAAIDTESHAIAEVARRLQLPLLVVRAVAEPAELTRSAVLAQQGEGSALAVAARLIGRPWELPAVWRNAQNGKLALAALRQVAALRPEPFAYQGG
jgi:adenosylhomocysteine nucleosidase